MLSPDTTRDILALAEQEAADAVMRNQGTEPPGFAFRMPLPLPPFATPESGCRAGSTA